MQCDVCQRTASGKLPFNCTLCARDTLYQPRLKHAQILLEKESIEKQIERSVGGDPRIARSSSSSSSGKQEVNPAWTIQRGLADQTTAEEQTQAIHTHLQLLRQEIHKMKAEIVTRKARLVRRRSELASAKQELSHSQDTAQEPLEKTIRRTTHRWDVLYAKTAESRLFLCREAARLYGLQQHKRKKGVRARDMYTIGGTPIADLRDLNSTAPSLSNSICHKTLLTLTPPQKMPLQPKSPSPQATLPTLSTLLPTTSPSNSPPKSPFLIGTTPRLRFSPLLLPTPPLGIFPFQAPHRLPALRPLAIKTIPIIDPYLGPASSVLTSLSKFSQRTTSSLTQTLWKPSSS